MFIQILTQAKFCFSAKRFRNDFSLQIFKDADLTIWLDKRTKDVPLFFKEIPAGSFLMDSRGYSSSEEPIHLVRISRPFFLGIFPVTQEQFEVWTRQSGIEHKNGFPDNPQHPADTMDWNEATAYCHWLTAHSGEHLASCYVAGLPTEAKWEYEPLQIGAERYGFARNSSTSSLSTLSGLRSIFSNVCPSTPRRVKKLRQFNFTELPGT